MAKIFQCDRCGKAFKRIRYRDHMHWIQNGKEPDISIREYDLGTVDLCENCRKSFDEWFDHPEKDEQFEIDEDHHETIEVSYVKPNKK